MVGVSASKNKYLAPFPSSLQTSSRHLPASSSDTPPPPRPPAQAFPPFSPPRFLPFLEGREPTLTLRRENQYLYPEGPKIKKIRDFDRDWKFRSRMKFSIEPPTAALFLWGNRDIEIKIFERDQKFRSRLKISIEIKFFWSLGPLGILAAFSPVRRGLFPVVRDFLCIIPTEQVLYYRNLGLYYGLASGTLPLYSGPCLGVKGGCVSCDFSPPPNRRKNRNIRSVHQEPKLIEN